MPYIIDGHNLIPFAGLQLDAADDELELIRLLQEYSRIHRRRIEVYFDGAPAARAGIRKFGQVTAHFISVRSSADAAIAGRLRSLKGDARNWTVVSSDAAVLAAAKHAHAETETSPEFALGLRGTDMHRSLGARPSAREGQVSEDDVRHWLNVFKKR